MVIYLAICNLQYKKLFNIHRIYYPDHMRIYAFGHDHICWWTIINLWYLVHLYFILLYQGFYKILDFHLGIKLILLSLLIIFFLYFSWIFFSIFIHFLLFLICYHLKHNIKQTYYWFKIKFDSYDIFSLDISGFEDTLLSSVWFEKIKLYVKKNV